MKPVGKPDAGNPHVRFDERGWETGRRPASAPAPNLDSTAGVFSTHGHLLRLTTTACGRSGLSHAQPLEDAVDVAQLAVQGEA